MASRHRLRHQQPRPSHRRRLLRGRPRRADRRPRRVHPRRLEPGAGARLPAAAPRRRSIHPAPLPLAERVTPTAVLTNLPTRSPPAPRFVCNALKRSVHFPNRLLHLLPTLLLFVRRRWQKHSRVAPAAAHASFPLAGRKEKRIMMGIVYLVLIAAALAGMWKAFEKMGRKGWEGIVPIYNIYILLQVIGRPVWWLVLCLVPLVNLATFVIISIDVAMA